LRELGGKTSSCCFFKKKVVTSSYKGLAKKEKERFKNKKLIKTN